MDAIHRLLAYAAVAGTGLGLGWSILLALTGRAEGPAFEWFQAAVVGVFVVGAASGVILIASGDRPGEGLHLLYAVIAIGVVPLARSFLGRAHGRRPAVLLLVAFAALVAVLYRLFTTG